MSDTPTPPFSYEELDAHNQAVRELIKKNDLQAVFVKAKEFLPGTGYTTLREAQLAEKEEK